MFRVGDSSDVKDVTAFFPKKLEFSAQLAPKAKT